MIDISIAMNLNSSLMLKPGSNGLFPGYLDIVNHEPPLSVQQSYSDIQDSNVTSAASNDMGNFMMIVNPTSPIFVKEKSANLARKYLKPFKLDGNGYKRPALNNTHLVTLALKNSSTGKFFSYDVVKTIYC